MSTSDLNKTWNKTDLEVASKIGVHQLYYRCQQNDGVKATSPELYELKARTPVPARLRYELLTHSLHQD